MRISSIITENIKFLFIMPMENEFEVNEFLALKLENGETNIYVAGKRFRSCTFLLLNIPVDKVSSFDEIDSIDEAADKLDASMESLTDQERATLIPPEVEFWGHSSNLQVWHENDYDTRLLRSNLAFPLLKELTDAGDPLAKRVFKEEIAKRLDSGYPSVVNFLIEESYDKYLTREELYSVLLVPEESEVIQKLEKYLIDVVAPEYAKTNKISLEEARLKMSLSLAPEVPDLPKLLGLDIEDIQGEAKKDPYRYYYRLIYSVYATRNKHVVKLKLSCFPQGLELPEFISKLTNLENLFLDYTHFTMFPKFLFSLTHLKKFLIYDETMFYSMGYEKIKRIMEEFEKKGISAEMV